MLKLQFNLRHQDIYLVNRGEVVATDSKNYLVAHFNTLTDDWETPLTAIFTDDKHKQPYAVIVGASEELEENECFVPWEVLTDECNVYVSVYCGNLHTTVTAAFRVQKSGYVEGETPPPPSPTVYDIIIQAIEDLRAEKQDKLIAGQNITIEGNVISASGGISDYTDLQNKPQINGVTLSGDKTAVELNLQERLITANEYLQITQGFESQILQFHYQTFLRRRNIFNDEFLDGAGYDFTDGYSANALQTLYSSGKIPIKETGVHFCFPRSGSSSQILLADVFYLIPQSGDLYYCKGTFTDGAPPTEAWESWRKINGGVTSYNDLTNKPTIKGYDIRNIELGRELIYTEGDSFGEITINQRNVFTNLSEITEDIGGDSSGFRGHHPFDNIDFLPTQDTGIVFEFRNIYRDPHTGLYHTEKTYMFFPSSGESIWLRTDVKVGTAEPVEGEWREIGGGSQIVSGVVNANGTITFTDSDGSTFTTTGPSVIGADGFSPVATVTQTASGATVSITDKNGTTTANISNGADGQDYVLTAQDKSDIADIVLSELPTTQGVLYGNASN